MPDPLVGRDLRLDARVVADLSDAERAMAALDGAAVSDRGPHRLETLARLLLRAEAVGSSRVEGLLVSPRRLALADLDPASDPSGRAREVVGNIRALERALGASAAGDVSVDRVSEIHAALLEGTRDAHLGGRIRTEQNWIGGHTPLDAEFVPPPPGEVRPLLEDLCAYATRDDHSPLVQAAVAHAQFETIHPFPDGNGRTGRALLQLILRRRGLCRRFVPPISLVLATWSARYVTALTGTRALDPAREAEGWSAWIELAAQATRVACAQAQLYERRIVALVEEWRARVRERVGPVRTDAAAWALLEVLPAAPLITSATASQLVGRSERAVDGAIGQLLQAGVLSQVGGRLRHRVFEAVGVFELVTLAERALASPTGDTKREPPVRTVPARPMKRPPR